MADKTTEQSVGQALAELREMFPNRWFELVTGASYDGWYYKIRVYGMRRMPAMSLNDAMDLVRAWHAEQAKREKKQK